jgi:hypothetical protein
MRWATRPGVHNDRAACACVSALLGLIAGLAGLPGA